MGRLVATDDVMRRAEFVSHDLGIEARWPMIVRGISLILAGTVGGSWVLWSLGRVFFSSPWWLLSAVAIGTVSAVIGTVALLRYVSPYDTPVTPLSYHFAVFAAEKRAKRTADNTPPIDIKPVGYVVKPPREGWAAFSGPPR